MFVHHETIGAKNSISFYIIYNFGSLLMFSLEKLCLLQYYRRLNNTADTKYSETRQSNNLKYGSKVTPNIKMSKMFQRMNGLCSDLDEFWIKLRRIRLIETKKLHETQWRFNIALHTIFLQLLFEGFPKWKEGSPLISNTEVRFYSFLLTIKFWSKSYLLDWIWWNDLSLDSIPCTYLHIARFPIF